MKTHSAKGTEETKDQAASMSEMADTLKKNCEQALRTSLKFQEEAGRWWSSVFNPTACAQQWQEQLNTITRTANSVLPIAQKPVSDLIQLAEKNGRTSAELMKKAFQASQAPAIGESQAKWAEFWAESLEALRSNAEAVSQIGAKTIDSWACFVKNNTEGTDARGAKAA